MLLSAGKARRDTATRNAPVTVRQYTAPLLLRLAHLTDGKAVSGYRDTFMKLLSGGVIIRNLSPAKQSFSHHQQAYQNHTMAKSNPNAERYISIARACLRAINESADSPASREEKIQAVYDAIDEAFQAQLADYRQSAAIMASVLERIASGQLSQDQAAELARKTLAQQPVTGPGNTLMH